MAKKKTILVKDILDFYPDESDRLVIWFYAYGCFYASTEIDKIKTVKEMRDRLRYDCLRAKVVRIEAQGGFNIENPPYTVIKAEMVY